MNLPPRKAPDFIDIKAWLNTHPIRIADLVGKVVGIEFWTRSCENCLRSLIPMQALAQKYHPQGFTLITVHTPETKADQNLVRLKKFVMQNHITLPIALDDKAKMWRNYHNRYWPTIYLLDKKGNIYSQHIGEGGYYRIEHDIMHLLKQAK